MTESVISTGQRALAQSPTFITEIAPDIVADLKLIGELARTRIGWVKGANAGDLAELKTLPTKMAELLEFNSETYDIDFRARSRRSGH